MKKVIINGRFYSQPITGVQRFARELLIALDEHIGSNVLNIEFVLALPPDSFDVPTFSNIKISKINFLKGHLWEQLSLPFFSLFRPLINLCNTAPITKRRQLVVIHDMAIYVVPEAYSFLFKLWYKVMYSACVFNRNVISTVSEFSKMEIHNILKIPLKNLNVLTEGREHILRVTEDLSIFQKFSFGKRPYVLAVSSMTPNKNFGIVVKAIEKIGNSVNFDFIIAGGANPKVFASTTNLLPESVTHVGYVSDGELVALYNNAACFIFPSLYEGFGLPPMEAMTCGYVLMQRFILIHLMSMMLIISFCMF